MPNDMFPLYKIILKNDRDVIYVAFTLYEKTSIFPFNKNYPLY